MKIKKDINLNNDFYYNYLNKNNINDKEKHINAYKEKYIEYISKGEKKNSNFDFNVIIKVIVLSKVINKIKIKNFLLILENNKIELDLEISKKIEELFPLLNNKDFNSKLNFQLKDNFKFLYNNECCLKNEIIELIKNFNLIISEAKNKNIENNQIEKKIKNQLFNSN